MEVGMLSANQKVSKDGEFLAYITKGDGRINGKSVKNGDLIQGENMDFQAGTK
jgi:hypothetical protein